MQVDDDKIYEVGGFQWAHDVPTHNLIVLGHKVWSEDHVLRIPHDLVAKDVSSIYLSI